jgi:curved DNA-binding protein CbpA
MGDTGQGRHDPYQVLGVSAGASQRDVVQAYRQAAQRAHPDARPGDPSAAAQFQALTEAYELLSDPDRRAGYDRGRQAAGPGTPPHRWPGTGTARRHSSPYLPRPPRQQPIWAGPVLIEPAVKPAANGQHGRSTPTAAWSDPPVVLGVPGDGVWGWAW